MNCLCCLLILIVKSTYFRRVEFLIIVQSLWTKALNGRIELMRECAQIELVLSMTLEALEALKCGEMSTRVVSSCRNCSQLLCLLRVAEMLAFVLSCIGENCLYDDCSSDSVGDESYLRIGAASGAANASTVAWIRILVKATSFIRRIESSLGDPNIIAASPPEVSIMFFAVRNSVIKMWSFAPRFLRGLYKSAFGMIHLKC